MKIRIKRLHEDAKIPRYATAGASGFDLHSVEDVMIHAGETKLVRTGLAFDVGPGYELQIRPRSGISLKTPIRIANSPGTIDNDYRGEVCVIVWNAGFSTSAPSSEADIVIKKGERIAQGVICPVVQAAIEEVDHLGDSQRGSNGFGSTGVN